MSADMTMHGRYDATCHKKKPRSESTRVPETSLRGPVVTVATH